MLTTLALAAALQQKPADCCQPGMDQFLADPAFMAAHPLRESTFVPVDGKMVKFSVQGGPQAAGYFVPPKGGSKTAVVMIHEWWGLNNNIKETAERLGKETGYGVLAADLYEGKIAKTPDEAGKAMQAVDESRAKAVVAAAVQALRGGALSKATKVGTVGYCFGGGWSLRTALAAPAGVQACVVYYGMPVTDVATLKSLKAPVLMIHPKKDRWITQKVVDDFRAAMKAAGKSLAVEQYDADHAFANPSNPGYRAKDAEDAWRKTLAFFKKNL